MIRADYHCHTLYCDGTNTPVEMIESAVAKGLSILGFSGHSYTDFDTSWCMSLSNTRKYIQEITSLKQKYKNKLTILCGIEQDYYSKESTDKYDYSIGSVHYISVNNTYIPIDETKEILLKACKTHFNNDIYALIETYYQTVSDICRKTNCDIIGHFDLISKFNEKMDIFDESHPRYIKAYKKAADNLIPYNKPFEINVGAMIRGYRSLPYPSLDIMQYIHEQGGSFILNSDSHSKHSICHKFDYWEERIRTLGYRLLHRLNIDDNKQ